MSQHQILSIQAEIRVLNEKINKINDKLTFICEEANKSAAKDIIDDKNVIKKRKYFYFF